MGELGRNVCKKYQLQLQLHPLRTKACTTSFLIGFSDFVSQKLSGAKKIQLRRLLLKMLFGYVYIGPFMHYMHKFMDWIFGGKRDNRTVFKRVLLEQLTVSPLNNFLILLYYGAVVDGRPLAEVSRIVRRQYPPLQLSSWMFWPTVSWINHRYVPFQLRVVFANLVACCWGIFLNLRSRSLALKKN